MRRSFCRFSLLLLLITGLSGCSENKMDYESRIQRQRFEKDKHFKYADASPLTEKSQQSFRSLSYFPIDSAYQVVARIKRLPHEDTFSMAYTNGKKQQFSKFAKLRFELRGKELALLVYKNLQPHKGSNNSLFIPFYDKTNGQSTYGGGRYLDITGKRMKGDTTLLDFNKSYNPYCAYNAEYTCPVPPEENRLKVAIQAGEKDFEK